jgi:phosphoribosylaminoimidazolecarboxamide formyltransferase / IMP cyclohydrolase
MEKNWRTIRRALLSVSDKTGLVEFASFLNKSDVELLSTGGTANSLRKAGIPVIEVSDYTGFPEMLDGRVKTLHPKIHGGLLGLRDNPSHQAQMKEHGIGAIDMIVVNLYPFRETAARPSATFEEVIEQIDIGGPSMLRSAAKNHGGVAVVTDPQDYELIMRELAENNCSLSGAARFTLAQKVFLQTASYDAAIAAYLAERTWSEEGMKKTGDGIPSLEVLALQKIRNLRYGENPHQQAGLFQRIAYPSFGIAGAQILHGKEVSYNNLLDSDAAWSLALEFNRPAAAVIKHTNPSGVAQSDTLRDAYVLARDCDPVSAFGSVVALNRIVDADTAGELNSTFVEVILAPEYTPEALEILKKKQNVRLLRVGLERFPYLEHRQIAGGFLVQDKDLYQTKPEELKVVTKRPPTAEEMEALLFGWRVVKHVKSNAIVFCNANRTLGIGAGQMSRVDSVKWGAQRTTFSLKEAVMASDAFFPFPDGLEAAAGYGITAVIQPGGSVRDNEVIQAADARDIAMVFTGIRHFRH